MPRVLVVDDERDLVSYLADQLNSQGYEVSSAYDGVEAVLKVAESDWDALLIDIRMPKLDGIGALRIIHRIKPDIPVVMFTEQASQSEMLLSTRLGAYTCLLKPINTDTLFKTLKEVL